MATLNEDYVSKETAKLMKDKRFDGECRAYYTPSDNDLHIAPTPLKYKIMLDKTIVLAPTLQIAMKWLRKVHKIFIEPKMSKNTFLWGYRVSISNGSTVCFHTNIFNECEEACEAAIKYCLKNLI